MAEKGRYGSIEEFLNAHPTMKAAKTDNIGKLASTFKPPKKGRSAAKGEKKPRKTREEMAPKYIPELNFEIRREPIEEGGRRGIKITLPFPPMTNHLYYTQIQKNTGVPLRFKSYQYKAYCDVLFGTKKKRGILQDIPECILKGSLIIKMKIFRPKLTGDWDSYIKAPQDVLKGKFFDDDKQIIRGEVDSLLDRDKPRVEVVLYEVGAQNNLF